MISLLADKIASKLRSIYLLITISVFTSSCSKFLDVSPDNFVLEDRLFESPDGVRMAVNGVYRSLSSTDLYGKNLSWGILSAASNTYRLTEDLPTELRMVANFEWESTAVSSLTEGIWKRAYHTIANCNLIIQRVKDLNYEAYDVPPFERDAVLGEMLAVRALIHFELLRLFAPPPLAKQSFSMPYVDKFPTHQPDYSTTEKVYTSIISDLEEASKLLAKVDLEYLNSSFLQVSSRLRNPKNLTSSDYGNFLHFRSQRLNYYAVRALISRVSLYMGDYVSAKLAAEDVYEAHMQGLFTWTPAANQGQINNIDVIWTKKPDELIFALSNNRNYDNWESSARGITAFTMANMPQLFSDDLDDFRMVGWYNRHGDQRYLTWVRPTGVSISAQEVASYQGPLIPVLGLPEIYHTLIECYVRSGELDTARALLEIVRFNRGVKRSLSDDLTAGEMMEELVRDIHKESLVGGQTFYLYKRLNRPLYNGNTVITLEPKNWQPTLPNSETAY